MFDKLRHKVQAIIFLILVFIAFTTSAFWIQWAFLAFISVTLLIIDYFFCHDDDFVFDPDYDHWNKLTQRRVLEFEDAQPGKNKKKQF